MPAVLIARRLIFPFAVYTIIIKTVYTVLQRQRIKRIGGFTEKEVPLGGAYSGLLSVLCR